jgi:hypothetical protein
VLCAVALLLASCGGTQKSSTSQSSQAPKTEQKTTTQDSSSDTQRVGEDGVGYVTIPSNWVEYQDVDNPDATQYCADDKTIVTMQSYAEHKGEITAKDAASNLYANMSDDSAVEDVEGAKVTLAGQNAYQVYGYYPDDDCFLVAWVLEDSDGVVHYVSAEGTRDTVTDAVDIVENTYGFTK